MSNVRAYRERLGMRKGELLHLIRQADPRVDLGTLIRIELGMALPPSEAALEALETALKADRSELFSGLEIFSVQDTESGIQPLTALIANIVPEGHENAISRKDLAAMMGVCDRKMRAYLEIAREDGLPISNDQDGKGYYQPVTPEECRRQYEQNKSRSMAILRQQRFLRARMLGNEVD